MDLSTDPFRILLQIASLLRASLLGLWSSISGPSRTPYSCPRPSSVLFYLLTLPLRLGTPFDVTGGSCTPPVSMPLGSRPAVTLPVPTAAKRDPHPNHAGPFHHGPFTVSLCSIPFLFPWTFASFYERPCAQGHSD